MTEGVRPGWRLTLDAVARYPRPGTLVPGALAFSPDSQLLTFLESETGDLVRSLWALDTETGERRVLARAPGGGTTDANVNPEEALRRERQRLREGGITHYSWAKSADRVLIPINGQLFLTSSAGEALRQIAADDRHAVDARLTADGSRVVFVRDGELWVVDVDSGAARRLTFDSADGVTNGLAEFIAQEEMGRSAGFWISPDGALVAFAQVDERDVAIYPIVHQGSDTWRVENHHYPFAGELNARVRLGVVSIDGGDTRWLDLGPHSDFYLARVDWQPHGRLAVQIESRDQRILELRSYNVQSGEFNTLVADLLDPWINLHNDLRFLDDGTFVWSSEQTGLRQLALHAADGSVIRELTRDEWPVDALVHLDEDRRLVYYLASGGHPTERHVFRVSLDEPGAERLTDEAGVNGAAFAPDGSRYAHTLESRHQPPTIDVHFPAGPPRVPVHTAASPAEIAPGLTAPEMVELTGRDGTRLYGAIYRPTVGNPPFPTIVSVYGGPHAQMVTDSWGATVDLRAQYLASLGFLVFKLDNRGSARRGLAFEGALSRRMGTVEVEDQVDGVRWLVGQGLTDPERVGIYGWSYGGYMTLMTLLTAPDVFKVGVAGAPVTDWDGYDTHYTERYMGAPTENPAGYQRASALAHAAQLEGKLLLVHGLVDENVHFRHTARLVAALQAAERPFDIVVFPEERHMPRDEQGRRYLEDRVVDFFTTHLHPGPDHNPD